jgi:putative transcriptional regulator
MNWGMIELRIEKMLGDRGRSLYWLAKEAEITYAALWNLKERRTDGITFPVLDRICKALECQPGDLLVRIEGDSPAGEVGQVSKTKKAGRVSKTKRAK